MRAFRVLLAIWTLLIPDWCPPASAGCFARIQARRSARQERRTVRRDTRRARRDVRQLSRQGFALFGPVGAGSFRAACNSRVTGSGVCPGVCPAARPAARPAVRAQLPASVSSRDIEAPPLPANEMGSATSLRGLPLPPSSILETSPSTLKVITPATPAIPESPTVPSEPPLNVTPKTIPDPLLPPDMSYRWWQDDTGKYHAYAALVSEHPGEAVLCKSNGVLVRVCVDRLSTADQQYLHFQRWQDDTGQYSAWARLISSDEDTVVLERTSGSRINVPRSRLHFDTISLALAH